MVAGRVTYYFDGVHLWYSLPSGRVLCYPHALIEEDGVTYAKASWKPAADAKQWPRARLWKGLACENIVQATAVDILRGALRELDAVGYEVVAHVHDEVVTEHPIDDAERASEDIKRIMTQSPSWAPDLPLAAGGKVMLRYGK
jgi:DNA polymerase